MIGGTVRKQRAFHSDGVLHQPVAGVWSGPVPVAYPVLGAPARGPQGQRIGIVSRTNPIIRPDPMLPAPVGPVFQPPASIGTTTYRPAPPGHRSPLVRRGRNG